MTAPRIVVPGATTAITRRTVLRKAFLAPWHPLVERCWLYALADAQRHTGVAVHHSVLVVSHHHTSVTPTRDDLPEFLRRFHRDLSCALHTLLARERYDAPRELFDDRQAHLLRLMDAEAQAAHLVYERLNPVAAGLVDRLEHMPLCALDFARWKVGFLEVERPPIYFDEGRPERLRLELTPPPLLYEAFDGDVDRLVHHMQRLTEEGRRALRGAQTKPALGAEALRRLHPWSEPRTLRESGGERVPTFRFGARGIVARRARKDGAREVSGFRRAHREARTARRDGGRTSRFPFGTYAARVHHGAPTESAPPPGAQIALPGPLLRDVSEACRGGERRARRAEGAGVVGALSLVEEVRSALRDEAALMVEDAEIDLTGPSAPRRPGSEEEGAPRDEAERAEERAPARVRHRFEPRREESARRLVVLRDRRRGRPPGSGGTHGSDPPG